MRMPAIKNWQCSYSWVWWCTPVILTEAGALGSPGQPALQSETLSQKKEKKKKSMGS
jgi:hypothetical protein